MKRKIISRKIISLLTASLLFALPILASPISKAKAVDIVNTRFEAVFSNYDSSKWEKANWANGSVFNCVWKPSQVTIENGKMVLTLDREYGGSYPYKSGEYRTTQFFGYGYYEVKMKAAKNIGIVSSFFTYTGPSDNNPWDEIDIEIHGKDTTKVQFNWYTNGVGGNEYFHNLGFDASQDFHTYGFEWRPNYIDYYVDGKKVYRGTRNIPSTPGKIMMNLWPGITVDEWLGPYDGRTPLRAEYEYVRYYPEGFPQSTPTHSPTPTKASTPTPTPNYSVKKGDVNGDGSVDSLDISLYKRFILRKIGELPVKDYYIIDVNGDGSVDSLDLSLVKRFVLRKIPSL